MKIHLKLLFCALLLLLLAPTITSAQRPELVVQTGHARFIYSAAFSPDGLILATISPDETIRLWDVSTGRVLRVLKLKGLAYDLAFSPDGKALASGGKGDEGEGPIKLWDVATGRVLRTLGGRSSRVYRVAFSSDAKTLASDGGDAIQLWDVTTGEELRTLTGHACPEHEPVTFAFRPDGKELASGCGETIKFWEVDTGEELRKLSAPARSRIDSVAFSPDGKTFAANISKTVRRRQGELVSIYDIAVVRLWEVATGKELHTLEGGGDERNILTVAFSPVGGILASGLHDTIKLWDIVTGKEIRSLKGHSNTVQCVAFSPEGKMLVSGSSDGLIKLWDVDSGKELRTLAGHAEYEATSALAFNADSKILAVGSLDKTVKLWDIAAGTELRTLSGHPGPVTAVALSRDGKTLASGSFVLSGQGEEERFDATIKLWNVSTGKDLRTLSWPTCVSSLSFSPDGRTLAGSCGYDAVIQLWDAATGKEQHKLRTVLEGGVTSVAFSPDGRVLASGSQASGPSYLKGAEAKLWDVVKLWDVATGKELRTLPAGSSAIYSVFFSPDGKVLGARDDGRKTTTLWDAATGEKLRTFTVDTIWNHGGAGEAFSPDGKILASGESNTIKLLNAATGEELRTLHCPFDVRFVAFNNDGRTLVSFSPDLKFRLWEVATGRELATFLIINRKDWLVATPDGLFDGPPSAWSQILWRFSPSLYDVAPVEAFFNEFYYPDLLAEVIAGRRPVAPQDIARKERSQPQIVLLMSGGQSAAAPLTAREVAVKITVKGAMAGAQDVRLFRNGALVKVWRGDVLKGQESATLDAELPIAAGENRLTAYAFNRDNVKSEDATLVIHGADNLKRAGTVYVLAVGVNKYANPQYNLRYAVADARSFAAEVKRQQGRIGHYGRVEVLSLFDREATKARILSALSELSRKAGPEDSAIIYFAGHGTAQANLFYLIPHDLGYVGDRVKIDEAGLSRMLENSISDRELERAFERVDAGHLLLVIDACNSGQALEAEEKRRGPMNSKGLAQLAYEKGMYILTAAQSFQAAQEASQLGHGLLTFALVEEGLKQAAADREPQDNMVLIREWLDYATRRVPDMQIEEMKRALSRGINLSFKEEERGLDMVKRSGQVPRVFYRRELEAQPLVVAKTREGQPRH